MRAWGTPGEHGAAPGRFTYPTDVDVLPGGGFVVADAYNYRIQAFDGDGALRWMRPEDTTAADTSRGRFNVATAVTAGPKGEVFAVDFENHRLQVFAPDGALLQVFGPRGEAPGAFLRPTDAALDADGNLYVVDFGHDRIQPFAPARRGGQ